jgi:hypothetical protein
VENYIKRPRIDVFGPDLGAGVTIRSVVVAHWVIDQLATSRKEEDPWVPQ